MVDADSDRGAEEDAPARALGNAQLGMVLAALVVVFLLIRARRAR